MLSELFKNKYTVVIVAIVIALVVYYVVSSRGTPESFRSPPRMISTPMMFTGDVSDKQIRAVFVRGPEQKTLWRIWKKSRPSDVFVVVNTGSPSEDVVATPAVEDIVYEATADEDSDDDEEVVNEEGVSEIQPIAENFQAVNDAYLVKRMAWHIDALGKKQLNIILDRDIGLNYKGTMNFTLTSPMTRPVRKYKKAFRKYKKQRMI